jgi:PRD1 phage membrane DNA delivery
MDKLTETLSAVAVMVVGVAILSVILSTKSNSVGVIQSLASGFGNILSVATGPVTGNSPTANLNYPTTGLGFGTFGIG